MNDHTHDDDNTRSTVVLTKGTMVSHYRIVEKIGAGGMGEIYLAEDTELDRKVALKFLPPHLCEDEDYRKRFKREAQAVAKLNHPNIVTIFEVAEHNGRPFFAMELVEGQSLRDLAKGKELGIDRIIELAIQVCDGLGAAHDKKVVHRDIKPSNIVIDAYGRPKILDFGLAAIQGGEHLTKTGSTLGTVQYMSPEQVHGKEVDHRSDLFSLGVVLYELITSRTPFEKDNEAATLKAITQDNPEPLARYKSDIPDELQRTVSKLLEKDPSLRYQHADGVISDLKRLIAPTQSSIAVAPTKQKSTWPFAIVGFVVIAALVVVGISDWPADDSAQVKSSTQERKMLAVLPFENLGSPEDEYFADGITDEITSRLARFTGLGVISRTSAMQYKGGSKSLRDIGRELGVDYILEGTIRWDKTGDIDRIRITPQLIKVSEDRHLWANNYERSLTQVFVIQSDIASQIAEALNVTLLGSEQSAITNWPTDNLKAYDYYLKGRDFVNRDENRLHAEEMFNKAIELDSSFALAYADLSHLHSYIYWTGTDPSPRRIELARTYAEKAMRLIPDLAEGHLALGYYYYYSGRNYERALEEFNMALEDQPNNSDLLAAVGYVKRRQGKWEEAYEYLKKSLKLDPTSLTKSYNFTSICSSLRKRREVLEECNRAIAMDPDCPWAWVVKVLSIGLYMGDTATAKTVLAEAETVISRTNMPYMFWHFDVSVGDFESALQRETRRIDTISSAKDSGDYYHNYASTYYFSGEKDKSDKYFDSARICLEKALRSDSVLGHYQDTKMMLAKTYAGLGRKKEAIELAREAIEELPRTKDAYSGTILLRDLCIVNITIGEYDTAIDILDTLLSIPSALNATFVQIHPGFDPLRDHPRFQALMEKYEKEHGI